MYVTLSVVFYLGLQQPLSFIMIVIITMIFIVIASKKARQPNAKVDGKEKNWRAGKIG